MCGCVKKDKSTTSHSTTNEYNRHYKANNRKYDDLGVPADAVRDSTSTEVVRFSATPSEPPPVDECCENNSKVEESSYAVLATDEDNYAELSTDNHDIEAEQGDDRV